MDVTHIPCGQDGWAHLAAVIDCHDREIVGYEFALRKTVVSTRLTKPTTLDNQTIIAAKYLYAGAERHD